MIRAERKRSSRSRPDDAAAKVIWDYSISEEVPRTGPTYELDDTTSAYLARTSLAERHKLFGFPRVIQRVIAGLYVSGSELALVIRENPGRPMPRVLALYLSDFLESKIKRAPGRHRMSDIDAAILDLAKSDFYRYRSALTAYKKSHGRLPPSIPAEDTGVPVRTPYEAAVALVREEYFSSLSHKGVCNKLFPSKRVTSRKTPAD